MNSAAGLGQLFMRIHGKAGTLPPMPQSDGSGASSAMGIELGAILPMSIRSCPSRRRHAAGRRAFGRTAKRGQA